jgi:hypothetical protein
VKIRTTDGLMMNVRVTEIWLMMFSSIAKINYREKVDECPAVLKET